MPEIITSVDLGLRRDWTAIVAVERTLPEGQDRHLYDVIHLERGHWELPGVVDRVGAVIAKAQQQVGADHAWLVLDRTGVGEFAPGPFRDAGLNPMPLHITGGNKDRFDWRSSGAYRTARSITAEGSVPKRDLAGVLQVLLETDRLRFAAELPELDVLLRELANFRAKITATGHDTYEAWRESDHDDTVLATALACWLGERPLRTVLGSQAEMKVTLIPRRDRTKVPW